MEGTVRGASPRTQLCNGRFKYDGVREGAQPRSLIGYNVFSIARLCYHDFHTYSHVLLDQSNAETFATAVGPKAQSGGVQ